jgi:Flp pilus assembly protein TadD
VFLSCGVTTLPLAPPLSPRFTLVLPDGGSAERLCRAGVRAMSWDALADPARMAAIPARAHHLARAWTGTLSRRAGTLFGFGGRMRDAEAPAAIADLLAARLEGQLAAYEYGRTLAATGRLAAAVVHEDVTGTVRAFLAGIRPAGVPTLHVPHGLYAEDRIVGGDVHGSVQTDLVAVAGAAQRDWFVRRGVAAERLIVTGNPAWDALHGIARPTEPLTGLEPGPLVTIATSWLGPAVGHHRAVRAYHERSMRAVRQAVALLRETRPTLRFVVKLHPSEPVAEAEHAWRGAGEAGAVPDLIVRERSPRVLAASDVLITLPSTIAVEAMLLGTPVVSPEFFYDGDAVLSVAGRVTPIAAAIDHVLAGWGRSADFEARRRVFVARHNGPCDGRAAERVARLVEETVARVPRRGEIAGAPSACRAHYLGAAELLIAAGNPASALVVLDEAPAAADGAEEVAAETLRATAFLQLQRAGDAETAFRRAVAAGGDGRAHVGLGLLLLERGVHDEAAMHLRVGVEREPGLDAGWSGLGVLAALEGREAQAVTLLERALGLNPGNPDARSALAVLRGECGERGPESTAPAMP